jgi:hypothetical protein
MLKTNDMNESDVHGKLSDVQDARAAIKEFQRANRPAKSTGKK